MSSFYKIRNVNNIILIFLYSVLDMIVSLYSLYFNKIGIGLFLVIHVLIFIVIEFLASKIVNLYKQIPYFIVIIPFFGGVIISLLIIITNFKMKDAKLIEDYEEYIKYNSLIKPITRVDINNNTKYMNMLDLFNHMPSERKKEAIVGVMDEKMDINVEILKNGLLDEDQEVIHYTASILNFLEKKYENELSEAREEYDKNNNINNLNILIKKIEKYLKSGVVTSDSLYIIQEEYSNYLKEMITRMPLSYEYYYKLLEHYLDIKNFDSFMELYEQTKRIVPATSNLSYLLMKYKYLNNEYLDLYILANKLRYMEIPIKEHEDIINYWSE